MRRQSVCRHTRTSLFTDYSLTTHHSPILPRTWRTFRRDTHGYLGSRPLPSLRILFVPSYQTVSIFFILLSVFFFQPDPQHPPSPEPCRSRARSRTQSLSCFHVGGTVWLAFPVSSTLYRASRRTSLVELVGPSQPVLIGQQSIQPQDKSFDPNPSSHHR